MDVEEFSTDALAQRLEGLPQTAAPTGTGLSVRERFRRTMFYQETPLLVNFEFGYWERTLEEWRKQGLPEDIDNEKKAYEYFGIESWAVVAVNPGPMAPFEHKVLEENEERIVYRDAMGCVAEINKKGNRSIPHFLDFPIKDRKTWQPFKEGLDPDDPRRYTNLEESLERLANSTVPVGIPGGSLVGIPRNLLGFHRIATLPYEDPELFEEIVNTFGECITAVLAKVLPRIQVDFCMGWEDICFNSGPIITPETYRRVVGPWYRRIADLLVAHGCCVYTTDTDGNIMPIVDVFLDHGLNTMFPVEVHGGSDPCALRDKYGKRIRLWGGFDKMALLGSKDDIERELLRLKPYVEQGGFIPGMDHRVQADVPLDNYKYYLDRKRALFNTGGEPRY